MPLLVKYMDVCVCSLLATFVISPLLSFWFVLCVFLSLICMPLVVSWSIWTFVSAFSVCHLRDFSSSLLLVCALCFSVCPLSCKLAHGRLCVCVLSLPPSRFLLGSSRCFFEGTLLSSGKQVELHQAGSILRHVCPPVRSNPNQSKSQVT